MWEAHHPGQVSAKSQRSGEGFEVRASACSGFGPEASVFQLASRQLCTSFSVQLSFMGFMGAEDVVSGIGGFGSRVYGFGFGGS